MSTWTDDMEDVFTDLVAEFGIEGGLSYNAQTGIDCILTPFNATFAMSETAYADQADTQIDVLRSDAETCGLLYALRNNGRPIVEVTRDAVATSFQVLSVQDDDTADPAIKLIARKEQ